MSGTQSDLFRAGARMRTAESKLREGQIREAKLEQLLDKAESDIAGLMVELAAAEETINVLLEADNG